MTVTVSVLTSPPEVVRESAAPEQNEGGNDDQARVDVSAGRAVLVVATHAREYHWRYGPMQHRTRQGGQDRTGQDACKYIKFGICHIMSYIR